MEFNVLNASGFMVALMLFFAVVFIYRAKLTQNTLFTLYSGYCCALAFAFLVNAFGQFILFILIMAVANIIGLVFLWPKFKDYIEDTHNKTIATINVSGPIRLRELFSASFALKLERDYGRRKAMAITIAIGVTLGTIVAIPIMHLMVLLHLTTWTIGIFVLVLNPVIVVVTCWDLYAKLPSITPESVN